MADAKAKIGIIAGSGSLPADLAKAALADGYDIHLVGIDGEAGEEITAFPHSFVRWGEIGRLFSILQTENCRDIVIIGRVQRPDLSKVRMDFGAWKLLPFILQLKNDGGDDSILTKIAQLFEDKGHKVCSVLDLVPSLAAPVGALTHLAPDREDLRDIEKGLTLVGALGQFDVGQAVVVVRDHVIAVEAAEGTDRMLERCRDLRQWGRKNRCGVLVKAPKPQQDRRIDLPAIGPQTVELASEANLAGIAIAAGETLVAERERTLRAAEKAGLFVVGVELSACSKPA